MYIYIYVNIHTSLSLYIYIYMYGCIHILWIRIYRRPSIPLRQQTMARQQSNEIKDEVDNYGWLAEVDDEAGVLWEWLL